MDRERLDYWCERGILGLTLAILVFGPLATGAVRTLELLVVQTLTFGAVFLWMARLWISPNHRVLWPPVCWAVLAFTAYAIVRYQQADIEYAAREELIKVLLYALLFFAILNNLHRQESTQLLALVLIFLGMGISLYAIYQFFTDSPYVWHFEKPAQYRKRASGTYICPNNLAGFLAMILPLGLACTLKGRFKPTTKVLLGYASIVMLAGLGATLSRGGWLATGLALAVFFAMLLRYRDSRLPALVFLALLLAGGVYAFKQSDQSQKRWQQIFREGGNVYDIRFYLWKPALQIWQQHFWWGAGPAHFDHRFPAVRPELVQMRPLRVHNDYLNTLADWGVVGTGLVASAWLLLGWGLLRTWKYVRRASDLSDKPSTRAAIVLGCAVGLFAILLHSVVDFNMHIPANAIVAVTLMAMLTGYLRFATEGYWVTLGWPGRTALTLAGVIALTYLGQQGFLRASEFVLLERAENIKRSVNKGFGALKQIQTQMESAEEIDMEAMAKLLQEIYAGQNEEIEALRKACGVEPMNFETTYKLGLALWNLGRQDRGENRRVLLEEAMQWFATGMRLNPFNAYNYLRYGMSLHDLKRHEEAGPYFDRALERDPKSYYIVAHIGWHYLQLKDYVRADEWFEKSLQIKLPDWGANHIALSYRAIIERELKEKPLGR